MNTSPIILRRINKLIGQAMNQAKKLKGHSLTLIRTAIKWLNVARREFKKGCSSYHLALRFACTDIRIINQWQANG